MPHVLPNSIEEAALHLAATARIVQAAGPMAKTADFDLASIQEYLKGLPGQAQGAIESAKAQLPSMETLKSYAPSFEDHPELYLGLGGAGLGALAGAANRKKRRFSGALQGAALGGLGGLGAGMIYGNAGASADEAKYDPEQAKMDKLPYAEQGLRQLPTAPLNTAGNAVADTVGSDGLTGRSLATMGTPAALGASYAGKRYDGKKWQQHLKQLGVGAEGGNPEKPPPLSEIDKQNLDAAIKPETRSPLEARYIAEHGLPTNGKVNPVRKLISSLPFGDNLPGAAPSGLAHTGSPGGHMTPATPEMIRSRAAGINPDTNLPRAIGSRAGRWGARGVGGLGGLVAGGLLNKGIDWATGVQ